MNPIAFVRSQLSFVPPYPHQDLSGQTIVVTGGNVGLGLEAARHFTRCQAERVIIGVRDLEKGKTARASIEESTHRKNVVEVWQLDLASYTSVKDFGRRLQGLKRLDALVENAGISMDRYSTAEDNETTITVNVVSTFLLGLLVLPKLRETASTFNMVPRLVIVTSELHSVAKFSERRGQDIFPTLNDRATAKMDDRYHVSKLLEVFAVRELVRQSAPSSKKADVAINCVNPGFCHSALTRNAQGLKGFMIGLLKTLLARTTEVGARTLVHAAQSGMESHGQYLSDCHVAEPAGLARNPETAQLQEKVWVELIAKLEIIEPGISQNI